MLFGNAVTRLSQHNFRDIRSHRPNEVTKYIRAKQKYLEDHNVYSRMETLMKSSYFDPDTLETIDRDITRASLHAGNLCKSHFRAGEWHKGIAAEREKLNILQRIISAHRTKRDMSIQIERLVANTKYCNTFELPKTIQECKELLKQTQQLIRTLIQEDKNLRKEELDQRAQAIAALKDSTKQAHILKRILKAEAVSKVYQYLRILRGGKHTQSYLKTILVPSDGKKTK